MSFGLTSASDLFYMKLDQNFEAVKNVIKMMTLAKNTSPVKQTVIMIDTSKFFRMNVENKLIIMLNKSKFTSKFDN